MDDSNEVQELLSRSYATPDYIDDADLEAGKMKEELLQCMCVIILSFSFLFKKLELEMLGTESFEFEEERPSYLDDLTGPATNKIGSDKLKDKEIGEIQ